MPDERRSRKGAPRMVTIRDVARLAGVSPMTVSNVLNNRESVLEENRRRVLAAIEASGYTRNESARQLRCGVATLAGVIVPEAVNPFYAEFAGGVESRLAEDEITTMVMVGHDRLDRELELLQLLRAYQAVGVAVSTVQNWAALRPEIARLADSGVQSVGLGTPRDVGVACSTVSGDDRAGGALVGEHLGRQAHRRIVMLGGPVHITVYAERWDGFCAGLAEVNPGVSANYVTVTETTLEVGYTQTAKLLKNRRTRPTALFCANDLLALGALRAATEAGLRVPDDLVIVGYDDIVFAASATVPLTSVGHDAFAMGRRAGELMLAGKPARHVVQAPTLCVRASSQQPERGATRRRTRTDCA